MTAPGNKAVCVFLLQLGGPKDLDGIKPFLTNLFEDVLPLPSLLRRPLAKLIAWRRTPEVTPLYQEIGGGSPLLANTEAQRDALRATLAKRGIDATILITMRYAPPRAAEALAYAREHCKHMPWVIVPLYPQYSYATTRSSLEELDGQLSLSERQKLQVVCAYQKDDKYLTAAAEGVEATLAKLPEGARDRVHLLFSAHGLPMKLVNDGDPYPEHIAATVEGVMGKLKKRPAHTLSYQSRVGPVKWLEPSTQTTLEKLGAQGCKEVVVVPIAFVSEHIETLHELDIQLRETAEKAGVTTYLRVPTVSVQGPFIEALADLVESRTSGGTQHCCGALRQCVYQGSSPAEAPAGAPVTA